jgi:hypothetical protein
MSLDPDVLDWVAHHRDSLELLRGNRGGIDPEQVTLPWPYRWAGSIEQQALRAGVLLIAPPLGLTGPFRLIAGPTAGVYLAAVALRDGRAQPVATKTTAEDVWKLSTTAFEVLANQLASGGGLAQQFAEAQRLKNQDATDALAYALGKKR